VGLLLLKIVDYGMIKNIVKCVIMGSVKNGSDYGMIKNIIEKCVILRWLKM
jgi:hypothetical protein